MSNRPNILYLAEATATGGREGHSRTSDGRVDVDLDVPTEMGGTGGPGTNPEQLFAAGYAACFQSALLRFAAGRKLDLSNSQVTARVGIGLLDTGGMGLAAAIDLEAPGESERRGSRADAACARDLPLLAGYARKHGRHTHRRRRGPGASSRLRR